MEESKTYVFGQDNNLFSALIPLLTQRGVDPSLLALMNNNGFGGNGGFLWFFFIIILWAWMGNGNGFGGFGNGNGTGFLANQLNNDAGRELLSQAIAGVNGSVERLATTLNCDVNAVQAGINGIMGAIDRVGNSVGMTGMQTINAIERGDASLAAQFAQCCCDQKLLATQQGYETRIAISDQTNTLGLQADRNTRSITDAISAQTTLITKEFCELKERELLNKIESLTAEKTALKGRLDNSEQTAQITGYFNSLIAPLQKEVDAIKCSIPNTVPVQWPNIIGVNTTPSIAGYYGGLYGNCGSNGSYWG